MKTRDLMKDLSDEIGKNKSFFKEFFDMNLDEGSFNKITFLIFF